MAAGEASGLRSSTFEVVTFSEIECLSGCDSVFASCVLRAARHLEEMGSHGDDPVVAAKRRFGHLQCAQTRFPARKPSPLPRCG